MAMSTNPKCGLEAALKFISANASFGASYAYRSREFNEHWKTITDALENAPQLQQRVSELEQQIFIARSSHDSVVAASGRLVEKAEAERDAVAEQLKQERERADGNYVSCERIKGKLSNTWNQLKLAIEAIEFAPHTEDCKVWIHMPGGVKRKGTDEMTARRCNCWKREALQKLGQGERSSASL